MLSQDRIKCEFLIEHRFGGLTLQKQAILQETEIFFATSGFTFTG